MGAQEIILFLAEYIDQRLDLETASVVDQELKYNPKGVLFLMTYGHTLSFYKRHHHNKEKIGWIIDYLDKRIPGSLSKLVEDLSYKGLLSLVRKDASIS